MKTCTFFRSTVQLIDDQTRDRLLAQLASRRNARVMLDRFDHATNLISPAPRRPTPSLLEAVQRLEARLDRRNGGAR